LITLSCHEWKNFKCRNSQTTSSTHEVNPIDISFDWTSIPYQHQYWHQLKHQNLKWTEKTNCFDSMKKERKTNYSIDVTSRLTKLTIKIRKCNKNKFPF